MNADVMGAEEVMTWNRQAADWAAAWLRASRKRMLRLQRDTRRT